MKNITAATLIDACSELSDDAGLLIRAELEPVGGPGSPVKPAVYAGGVYQKDRRWLGAGEERRVVDAVVIDNVPSEANRLEAALKAARADLGLPDVRLDLTSVGALPAHLPRVLSGFDFPHRQADAYLRDAVLDGTAFLKTDAGKALEAATADSSGALFRWFPQALLFGFWQSHLGKKGTQAKLARSWVSEIVGYEPATLDTRQAGLKGDPLNLNIAEKVRYSPDVMVGWTAGPHDGKKQDGEEDKGLSDIGHGQVPIGGLNPDKVPAPAAVSFEAIEQTATVSFASLRRVRTGQPEADAAGRALLVALGLVAHMDAFGRPFTLRSECDLRPRSVTWTWLGSETDEQACVPDRSQARALFRECVELAERAGLPVGSRWDEALVLEPNQQLVRVIQDSWPPES